MWSDLLVACLIPLPALIYGAVQWLTYLQLTPMANEVVVQWSMNESERREFDSRRAAVRFVMEELESGRRHNVRMIAEGTEFNIVDIVRMYAGRKPYRRI